MPHPLGTFDTLGGGGDWNSFTQIYALGFWPAYSDHVSVIGPLGFPVPNAVHDAGFEPAHSAWKADMLPLTSIMHRCTVSGHIRCQMCVIPVTRTPDHNPLGEGTFVISEFKVCLGTRERTRTANLPDSMPGALPIELPLRCVVEGSIRDIRT